MGCFTNSDRTYSSAFATSTELAISLKAAMNDSADLVLGNIIGSNIANILLILGITDSLHLANKTAYCSNRYTIVQ